jgi:HK97 family phage prohead protease
MANDPFFRTFDFTFSDTRGESDGLTLEGYAAVFDSPTTISERGRTFTETVQHGAFKRTLEYRQPMLMFNHGQHPLIGDMPLGRITHIREDAKGLFVQARLSNNWLIQPVRDAIADGAVTGMSFRFETIRDKWSADKKHRTLTEVRCAELGPVGMPAYEKTTVGVRSHEAWQLLSDPEVQRDLFKVPMLDDPPTRSAATPEGGPKMRSKAERQAIAARVRSGGTGSKAERMAKARALKAGTGSVVTPAMRERWERETQRRVGVILDRQVESRSTWPWLSVSDCDRLRGARETSAPRRYESPKQRRARLRRRAAKLQADRGKSEVGYDWFKGLTGR